MKRKLIYALLIAAALVWFGVITGSTYYVVSEIVEASYREGVYEAFRDIFGPRQR